MGEEVIEKLKQLPLDKQQEVDDFITFLIEKYSVARDVAETVIEKRQRNVGWAKGKIWMADDFNDTPADFKDYV